MFQINCLFERRSFWVAIHSNATFIKINQPSFLFSTNTHRPRMRPHAPSNSPPPKTASWYV